ncbi:formyl transferase [Infundibulicybe gibba]|nr:formyl transferase [Infundibulicybe gibba]
MGRDEFSCLVLRELHAAPDTWQEISVVTHPDEYVGRRKSQLSVSPLKSLAESLELPVYEIPHSKPDFKHWKPPQQFLPTPETGTPHMTHLVLTASFGRILSAPLLGHFLPSHRLNVHPSALPLYRGPAPIQHTILNGDAETGVCVIQMLKRVQGIDAGGIWGRVNIPVPAAATFATLRDALAIQGGKLLVSVLRQMLSRTAVLVPQDPNTNASHAPAIQASDALVDFRKMTAEDIVRRWRTITRELNHQSVAPTVTHFSHKSVQLHDPHRSLLIQCAASTILSVPRVKAEGRPLLAAREWWNGVKGLGLVGCTSGVAREKHGGVVLGGRLGVVLGE